MTDRRGRTDPTSSHRTVLHPGHPRGGIDAGVPVLREKPIAVNMAESFPVLEYIRGRGFGRALGTRTAHGGAHSYRFAQGLSPIEVG